MMLRPGQRLLTVLAAFAASIAMLLYAFSAPGSHAPRLHSASVEVMVSSDHQDHGDHSHDEGDVDDATGDVADHHHADHTHDKAELVAFDHAGTRALPGATYIVLSPDLTGRPPYGIDRPPRPVTLT
ncbi:hypothetical protein BC360_27080 [Ensifer sp. LC163]|nr:hypothetical protein BC360_27080 [Ensifer sp. LC163]